MISQSRFSAFSMAFAVAIISFPAAADVGECMNLDPDEIAADVNFKVLDDSCDSDGVCAYRLRIPAKSKDGDLTVVALVVYDSAGTDELLVELDYDVLDDGDAEVMFFAHKKYSASLVVRAGYHAAGECSKVATYRPRS